MRCLHGAAFPRSHGSYAATSVRPCPSTLINRPVHTPSKLLLNRCFATGKEAQFNAEQLAFLERKRKYKLGLGPAMPQGSICPDCNGKGIVVCWECSGAGVNHRNVEEIMGCSMENVRQQNGVINVQWFLMKGGPCFICRGKPDVPCRSCEGTGITGFDLMQYTGD